MNDLTDIIKQAEADVQAREAASTAADARAAAAQADAAAARESLKEARLVVEWLRRHTPAQPHAAPPGQQPERVQPQPATRFGKPVPEKALTDRCQEALEEFGGTATNKQILARLIRDGVDVNLEQVRNTMAYLSRKKPPMVTTEKGSGLWRLLRPVTPDPGRLLLASSTMNGATGGER